MKSFHAFLFVAILMAACDQRGSSPVSEVGVGSNGPGTTTPTTNDSTPVDTSQSTLKLLHAADIAGPSSMPTPGTDRRVYFYLAADRSLRVVGSSDGAPAGGAGPSFGRLTTWEIRLSSQDSIRGNFPVYTIDRGLGDTMWNYVDSSRANLPHIVRIRMHTIGGAPEARIVADSNALISVKILAWSGFDTKDLGWTPPILPDDTVAGLVWAGTPAKIVGTSTFQIRIPSSSRY